MPWAVALLVVSLLAALAALFVTASFMIRRDMKERFDRIRVRLEEEAHAVLRDLLNGHKRS